MLGKGPFNGIAERQTLHEALAPLELVFKHWPQKYSVEGC
jgi:hypothetical protein